LYQPGSDSDGAVAVGGNLNVPGLLAIHHHLFFQFILILPIGSFTVFNGNDGTTPYALVVAGDVTGLSEGETEDEERANFLYWIVGTHIIDTKGDIVVGGTYSGGAVIFNGDGTLTQHATSLPIDFPTTNAYQKKKKIKIKERERKGEMRCLWFKFSYLTQLSQAWAALPANGNAVFTFSNYNMFCTSAATQVFDIDGTKFTGSYAFTFFNCTADQVLIINVFGATVAVSHNRGEKRGEKRESRWWIDSRKFQNAAQPTFPNSKNTVFNFVNATSLTVKNTNFDATILAPLAGIYCLF
jgi:choice-of-anchor A domain-containing protein